MIADSLLRDLRRCVADRILTTGADLAPYARDFGGLFRAQPAAVVPVSSEEETCGVLRLLRNAGVPVTIRGSGFSCDGQSLGEGVVIAQQPESGTRTLTESGFETAARARWASVVETLRGHRLTPPVLTYSLQTSIGGTLSAGGYGPASIAAGAQVDHVRRLRIILPDGEALWCSPDEHAEIFRFALAGMGRIGVIERVEMDAVPYRPSLRLVTREHRDLRELREHVVNADGDIFFADCAGGTIRSTTGYDADGGDAVVPREILHAQVVPAAEPFVHVWCDYFVDGAGLGPFLDFIDDGITKEGLDRIHILSIKRPEAAGRRAYPPLALFAGTHYYGVGVFYAMPEADVDAIRGARAAQRALLDECLRLGGRPYLCGAHDLTDDEIGAIYGEEHDALERLRDELDPGRLFNRLTRSSYIGGSR
ncbi:MAG: hypothetical protein QOE68_1671 [Thermoanaerobaculia bacterium]|jgi:FAD/FMN-containing dehydrogenase|nr:hypothetical protein [Thermoanaerobaculia bacterium]